VRNVSQTIVERLGATMYASHAASALALADENGRGDVVANVSAVFLAVRYVDEHKL
jgi:hypothetical protein